MTYTDLTSGLLSPVTGLRLNTVSVRRRVCCRLPSISQHVFAVFEPHNQQLPPLIEVCYQRRIGTLAPLPYTFSFGVDYVQR